MAEKNLTFKEKIDIILKIKDLTVKGLEEEWGKNGTIYKALKKPKGLGKRLTTEFLLKFHIKKSWWLKPVGTDEASVFEKNGTSVGKSTQKDTEVGELKDAVISLLRDKVAELEQKLAEQKSRGK